MFKSAAFALAAAKLVAGHATFQSIVIDGKDQGQHFAVQTPSNGNNPILDVTSTAMICNGGAATTDFVEIAAGAEIGLQWHHNDPATLSGDADEPIAASHKGPVMVYIAPKESNGEGDVWVKIWEDGYTDGKWGVDNFITNKGLITVTLPDLAAGEYLIRPELIGLHEGNREGGAQFYNGCGQLKITGSGSATLPAGVDITKAYSASDAGVLVDIYSGLTSYEIPGPAVWDGASGAGSGSGSGNESSPAPATSATPVASSTPSATASPVAEEAPAQTSAAAPAPSAGGNTGSGSLPESFTLEQFISWLQESAGSSTKKARRHARAFL